MINKGLKAELDIQKFLKMGQPRAIFRLFLVLSNVNNTIIITNQCQKCHVHPVYSAGIQTHNLLNKSRLP